MNQSPPLISATMPAFQITVVELFFVRLLTNKEEVNRMKVGGLAKCLYVIADFHYVMKAIFAIFCL